MATVGSWTFDEAVAYCNSTGREIASVHSQDENDIVLHIATANNVDGSKFYLGATSDGAGTWTWRDSSAWDYVPPADARDDLNSASQTRIVVVSNDDAWRDWQPGPQQTFGVVCRASDTGACCLCHVAAFGTS